MLKCPASKLYCTMALVICLIVKYYVYAYIRCMLHYMSPSLVKHYVYAYIPCVLHYIESITQCMCGVQRLCKDHTSMPAAARMTKAMVMPKESPAMPMRHVKSPPKVMVLHSSHRRPLMPNLQPFTHPSGQGSKMSAASGAIEGVPIPTSCKGTLKSLSHSKGQSGAN